MHRDAQIRAALVALLTGLPSTGSRVYGSRVYPDGPDDLPALAVFVREGAVEERLFSPGSEVRELSIAIQVRAMAAADLDDVIDVSKAEIEAAIKTDPTLGGLVLALELSAYETEIPESELEQPVGELTMTYGAMYSIEEHSPES